MVDADPDAVLLVDDPAVVQRLLVHPELVRDYLSKEYFFITGRNLSETLSVETQLIIFRTAETI